MVNTSKIKALAKRKGMTMKLVEKRKQLRGSGVIWDFDVSGGNVSRVKIAQNRLGASANVYYGDSSKSGVEIKSEAQLVKFMESVN